MSGLDVDTIMMRLDLDDGRCSPKPNTVYYDQKKNEFEINYKKNIFNIANDRPIEEIIAIIKQKMDLIDSSSS